MSKSAIAPRIDLNQIKHNAISLRLSEIKNMMDNFMSEGISYERKFVAFMHLCRLFEDLEKDDVLNLANAGNSAEDVDSFVSDPQLVSAFTEVFIK